MFPDCVDVHFTFPLCSLHVPFMFPYFVFVLNSGQTLDLYVFQLARRFCEPSSDVFSCCPVALKVPELYPSVGESRCVCSTTGDTADLFYHSPSDRIASNYSKSAETNPEVRISFRPNTYHSLTHTFDCFFLWRIHLLFYDTKGVTCGYIITGSVQEILEPTKTARGKLNSFYQWTEMGTGAILTFRSGRYRIYIELVMLPCVHIGPLPILSPISDLARLIG